MSTGMDTLAPLGYIYFCPLCGKSSPTQSGWHKKLYVADRRWDVACMLNCMLITLKQLEEIRKAQNEKALVNT